jgi:hypothetical protein
VAITVRAGAGWLRVRLTLAIENIALRDRVRDSGMGQYHQEELAPFCTRVLILECVPLYKWVLTLKWWMRVELRQIEAVKLALK